MFFFPLNKETFGVKFSNVGTNTIAELYVVSERGITPAKIMATSILGRKDKFSKKVGNKKALAKLLDKLDEYYEDEHREYVVSKEDREKIWELYFKTHKK